MAGHYNLHRTYPGKTLKTWSKRGQNHGVLGPYFQPYRYRKYVGSNWDREGFVAQPQLHSSPPGRERSDQINFVGLFFGKDFMVLAK